MKGVRFTNLLLRKIRAFQEGLQLYAQGSINACVERHMQSRRQGAGCTEAGRKKRAITIWFVVQQYSLTFLLPCAKRRVEKHNPASIALPVVGIWHHSGWNKSPTSLVGAGPLVSVASLLVYFFHASTDTHPHVHTVMQKNFTLTTWFFQPAAQKLGKTSQHAWCWKSQLSVNGKKRPTTFFLKVFHEFETEGVWMVLISFKSHKLEMKQAIFRCRGHPT